MRGEAEKECFELVKQKYNEILFFGTSVEDEELIQKALQEAKENPNPSRFPDFIFDNGFIEHFSVTSSFQNKHGSTMKRENAEIEREFNQLASAYVNSLPKDNPTVYSVETPICFHETHSYENFVKSFKCNFEDHIENSKNYTGSKEHSIFMIEYSDSALRMSKRLPKDLKHEVSYGDLLSKEKPTYKLSRDIELLKFLHDKCTSVEYVFFVNRDNFSRVVIECFKTQNALEVVKLLGNGYDFHCAMISSSHVGVGAFAPNEDIVV